MDPHWDLIKARRRDLSSEKLMVRHSASSRGHHWVWQMGSSLVIRMVHY